jgi:hypothetical protein
MPVNDIGAIYTPSIYGRTSFPIRHNAEPIFYKTFDGSNDSIVGLSSDKITVREHFFKTGEPLTYNAGTGTSIGISSLSPGNIGFTTYLPSTVYPIVIDKDNIRVALASSLARQGEYVDINNLGIGSVHTLLAEKQNAKSLICIGNIIQSPISVASTVGIVTYTNTSLQLDKLENIKLGSFLRINEEIVKVSAINYSTKDISISRGSGVMGTPQKNFSGIITTTPAEVLSGNYNIVKDIIYFADPPLEGKKINLTIPVADIDFADASFTYFTGNDANIISGSQAVFYSENPPQELITGNVYYLIRSANNTFRFATTLFNAFNGNYIEFTNVSGNEFPVASFQLFLILPTENNSFQGRVFLRSNYDGNNVFDDVSEQFTGITSSFELTISGITTVGIRSDNGIVLINNIFQYPEFEESFEFREVGVGSTGQTFLDFKGFDDSKTYDVNVKGLPRGGIIVSYGVTSGSNYLPLIPATGYAVVSAAGTISNIYFGDNGSGYRSGISTYYFYVDNGELPGDGGYGTISPNGFGLIDSFEILSGGSGYTYNGLSTSLSTTINALDPNGTPIGVGTTSIFEYYRGSPVNALNPGYVKIDDEIIKYTGISNSTSELTGTLRGMLGSSGGLHSSGTSVVKYEYYYIIKFDAPSPYDDIPLSGSTSGIGASVSFEVNQNGEIKNLLFTNKGYNYKVGEVLVPTGTIGLSTQIENDKLKITINEVAKDEFAAWNIGRLRKLNDLSPKVNSVRKIFTLTETVDGRIRRTSLESDPGGEIDLSYNLLVFVNDILQIPNESYVFLGGSQLEFSEPPSLGSSVKVYFYEGFDGDAPFFQSQTDVKEGDKLQIQRNIFEAPPLSQFSRTAKRIVSSDTLKTEVYTSVGLSDDSSQRRSISWTPQKSDAIIGGEYVSKSRDEWSSGITSITKISLPIYSGLTTVGYSTYASGTFVGVNTNIIGINTNAGIGTLLKLGDYVEGSYVSIGVTIVSIGSSYIDIGSPGITSTYLGDSSYSFSPIGTNTIPVRFYRIN